MYYKKYQAFKPSAVMHHPTGKVIYAQTLRLLCIHDYNLLHNLRIMQ